MIRHFAGLAEVVDDLDSAVRWYRDVLALSVRVNEKAGYAVVEVPGVLHFGVWLRASAARLVMGDGAALDSIPLGFTIGFEVDDVNSAARALAERHAMIVQGPQHETWGQTTSRFLLTSGALCEVSETPKARRLAVDVHPMASESRTLPS